MESQKGQYEQLCNRKITSVEDLFETQRKELFSKMTELEKGLNAKQTSLARAITEIAKEIKMDEHNLIV